DTGDASSTAVAFANRASTRSPCSRARRMATTATSSITATASSHSTEPMSSGGPKREITALKDWLVAKYAAPIRPVSGRVSSQYFEEVAGITANARAVKPKVDARMVALV